MHTKKRKKLMMIWKDKCLYKNNKIYQNKKKIDLKNSKQI